MPPQTIALHRPDGVPLWPLALLAGLLPLVATLVAWALSVQLELVPACNPFWDGCTSISRAARHDLPNHLFQLLMLPAATLQGLVWLLAAHWLLGEQGRAQGPRAGLVALAVLGVVAAAALVLYATFLGTEGRAYRLLRQYGTVMYFGFTCICMLLVGGALQRLQRRTPGRLPAALVHAHVGMACTLVLLGVGNAIVAALMGPALKGRVENVTEWWGALLFVLCFWALAAIWWRVGLRLRLAASD